MMSYRPGTAKMKELRVYLNPPGTDARGARAMFYSRRADGPYYRWLYEEEWGRWRASRVHLSGSALRALCIARWQSVPTALQAKLGEHYLE